MTEYMLHPKLETYNCTRIRIPFWSVKLTCDSRWEFKVRCGVAHLTPFPVISFDSQRHFSPRGCIHIRIRFVSQLLCSFASLAFRAMNSSQPHLCSKFSRRMLYIQEANVLNFGPPRLPRPFVPYHCNIIKIK
jgi:hypothetical protein